MRLCCVLKQKERRVGTTAGLLLLLLVLSCCVLVLHAEIESRIVGQDLRVGGHGETQVLLTSGATAYGRTNYQHAAASVKQATRM